MGGQAWKWVAPFGADAIKVLSKAREEAFRKRAYGKPEHRGQPRTSTLDELMEALQGVRSCSIIDVTDIGDTPGVGVAGPFSRGVLKEALGTLRPTREQAEAGIEALYEELEQGQSAYVVCYEDGEPAEVLFLGYSMD